MRATRFGFLGALGAGTAVLSACGVRDSTCIANFSDPKDQSATYAFFVKRMRDQTILYEKNADRALPAASLAKLLVLIVALQSAPTSTSLYTTNIGRNQSLASEIEKMIVYSDNAAANRLIAYFGYSAINEMARQLQLNVTRITHPYVVQSDRQLRPRVFTTAREVADIMQYIMKQAGKIGDEGLKFTIGLGFLIDQTDKSLIPAGLPRMIEAANKTGEIHQFLGDACIAQPRSEDPYIAVGLANGFENRGNAVSAFNQLGLSLFGAILRTMKTSQ